MKSTSPGGLVQKTQYDGAGRAMKSFTSDGGSDSTYAHAFDVASDNVLEQSEMEYDANSNVQKTTSRQRFHDETGTGELGDASSGVLARVSYDGYYCDLADRPIASITVGTNGGTARTRPTELDHAYNVRSDTVLRTDTSYDAAGRVEFVTDPMGRMSKTQYDLLGRTLTTFENYIDGTVGDDNDKKTAYTYGPAGMTSLTAYTTSSNAQTTEWVYGFTTGDLITNDAVRETRWPDPSTGASSSGQADAMTINALGQTKTSTDRNGNVHTLSYDVLGRLTKDVVSTLGSGVDGAVRRIETAYDTQGNAYLFTSYDATTSGTITSQVQRAFNGLGQLITEYQSHSGAVNTGTTPKVQYAYSEMASSANHSRLTSMTYPNGKVLGYNYASGLDSSISRLTSLSDTGGTLEDYAYLGLGTVVKRSHPLPTSPASSLDLTYITSSAGDAGDQYGGLDHFGRVVDQNWKVGSTVKDEFQYGYDRNSNRLWRDNLTSGGTNFGELYTYDSINQIASFKRGDLNSTHTALETSTQTRSQDWNYDGLGNWDSLTTDGGSPQTRTHNAQNEITAVSGQTIPTFDANGNMTKDETDKRYVYDAWNRLVTVMNSGNTVIAEYKYDALTRRVAETSSGTTKDLYYSAGWQVLEERITGTANIQYVWSPVYIDSMILRDRDLDHDTAHTLEERLWVAQDANFNVTALIDGTGAVVERFTYDPFGTATVHDGNFTVDSGGTDYAWIYRHQGGRWSSASGLVDFKRRPTSTTIGRWIQNDPIGYAGDGGNLYVYINNSPTSNVDPLGLCSSRSVVPAETNPNWVPDPDFLKKVFPGRDRCESMIEQHRLLSRAYQSIYNRLELKRARLVLAQDSLSRHQASYKGTLLAIASTPKTNIDRLEELEIRKKQTMGFIEEYDKVVDGIFNDINDSLIVLNKLSEKMNSLRADISVLCKRYIYPIEPSDPGAMFPLPAYDPNIIYPELPGVARGEPIDDLWPSDYPPWRIPSIDPKDFN